MRGGSLYELKEYPEYYLNDELEVVRRKDGKVMPAYARSPSRTTFRLKNASGVWKEPSYSRVLAEAGFNKPPEGYVEVKKYPGIFISKNGSVWSCPSKSKPQGIYLSTFIPKGSSQYPTVTTGKYGTLTIHMLLGLAFLDPLYIEKGLCVMHLDDNKLNFSITNLKIATYSENNKAAYETGANPGRG